MNLSLIIIAILVIFIVAVAVTVITESSSTTTNPETEIQIEDFQAQLKELEELLPQLKSLRSTNRGIVTKLAKKAVKSKEDKDIIRYINAFYRLNTIEDTYDYSIDVYNNQKEQFCKPYLESTLNYIKNEIEDGFDFNIESDDLYKEDPKGFLKSTLETIKAKYPNE